MLRAQEQDQWFHTNIDSLAQCTFTLALLCVKPCQRPTRHRQEQDMALAPSAASSRGGSGECGRFLSHVLLVTLTGTGWHWPSSSPQRMHTWKRPRRETVMTSGPRHSPLSLALTHRPHLHWPPAVRLQIAGEGPEAAPAPWAAVPTLSARKRVASQRTAQLSLLVFWRLREWWPLGHQMLSQEQ